MILQSLTRRGAPLARERRGEHRGIKTIGRLVLLCAVGLVVSAFLLVMTALQVVQSLDRADLATERQRAANAVDIMTATGGPLTHDQVIILGRIAGLDDAHLSYELTSTPRVEQIPLLAGQGPSGSYLTWTRSGMAEQVFLQYAPIRLPIIGGMLLLVLGVMFKLRQVVADIERQRRQAFQQSRSDVMTGLANRLAFETALADLVADKTRFAILLFDLDRFKEINDLHGHAAGDGVLRAIGTRLSRLLEDGDLLARLGGDEFVVLSTGHSDRAALAALAQRCIATIEQPIQLEKQAVRVGVSLGIVPADALDLPPDTLMGAADAALYRAKSSPGSSFRFAGDEPAPQMIHQQLLASA
ncbi:GGDEF domain-containing protein [Devosia sp. SL43]|uniref:GGDEF domain-containing protein n=1 Tax=Devosia sp. SL43 TaxID=2806348 RepID=UPI001F1EA809|nr:GGDEF domain-containing protein [Devosia sp. SL43]UJW84512.1 GGDEF domain-containing protein [Devosia sp. SL43]